MYRIRAELMLIVHSAIYDEVQLTLPIRLWLVDNRRRLNQYRLRCCYMYMDVQRTREVIQSRVDVLSRQRITPTLNPRINAPIVAQCTQSPKQIVSQRICT
jgi:hypothetical protein